MSGDAMIRQGGDTPCLATPGLTTPGLTTPNLPPLPPCPLCGSAAAIAPNSERVACQTCSCQAALTHWLRRHSAAWPHGDLAVIAEIDAMVGAGETGKAIADRFDVSIASVRNFLRGRGARTRGKRGRPPQHGDSKRQKAVERVRAGATIGAAAREAGVAWTTVERWTRQAGLAPARQPRDARRYDAETRRRAVEMVAGGRSVNAAAGAVGASWNTVETWVRKAREAAERAGAA